MVGFDRFISILAIFFMAIMVPLAATAMNTPAGQESTMLEVGDEAPDFELSDQDGEPVRLSSFRGKKNVVLAFYVLAFTGG